MAKLREVYESNAYVTSAGNVSFFVCDYYYHDNVETCIMKYGRDGIPQKRNTLNAQGAGIIHCREDKHAHFLSFGNKEHTLVVLDNNYEIKNVKSIYYHPVYIDSEIAFLAYHPSRYAVSNNAEFKILDFGAFTDVVHFSDNIYFIVDALNGGVIYVFDSNEMKVINTLIITDFARAHSNLYKYEGQVYYSYTDRNNLTRIITINPTCSEEMFQCPGSNFSIVVTNSTIAIHPDNTVLIIDKKTHEIIYKFPLKPFEPLYALVSEHLLYGDGHMLGCFNFLIGKKDKYRINGDIINYFFTNSNFFAIADNRRIVEKDNRPQLMTSYAFGE